MGGGVEPPQSPTNLKSTVTFTVVNNKQLIPSRSLCCGCYDDGLNLAMRLGSVDIHQPHLNYVQIDAGCFSAAPHAIVLSYKCYDANLTGIVIFSSFNRLQAYIGNNRPLLRILRELPLKTGLTYKCLRLQHTWYAGKMLVSCSCRRYSVKLTTIFNIFIRIVSAVIIAVAEKILLDAFRQMRTFSLSRFADDRSFISKCITRIMLQLIISLKCI